MLVQTNRHGLPIPPAATAFLVVAIVAFVWAVGMFAAGFVVAAAVIAAVALACAVVSRAKRKPALTPTQDG